MCKVTISAVRPETEIGVEKVMEQDGWNTVKQGGKIVARHEEVKDQTSARERLHRLGLLLLSSITLYID